MTTRFYTVASLSPKRHMTPEGFLVCEDVPVARIGEQIYGPDETPIQPNRLGFVRILREPDEVFRPETLASAQGKPIVRDHPDTLEVTPRTFRELSAGVMINPRQGKAGDDDVILADLMVMHGAEIDRLIDAFEKGETPEVSMGYDCDYEEIGEAGSGLGRQRNILFNHVALVDQGRCGPRCSIGDHKRGLQNMANKTSVGRALDALRRALKSKDEKKIEEAVADCEKQIGDALPEDDTSNAGGVTIHNHMPAVGDSEPEDGETKKRVEDLEKKVEDGFKKIGDSFEELKKSIESKGGDSESEENKKILGELEAEAPPGTGDAAKKAKDSEYLADSYQRTVADVEIIAPGLRVPTFDRAMAPAKSFDAICKARRSALDVAMLTPEIRTFVDNVSGGRAFDTKTATCDATRTMFNAVVQMKRQLNNADATSSARRVPDHGARGGQGPTSIADLNKMNAARRGEKVA